MSALSDEMPAELAGFLDERTPPSFGILDVICPEPIVLIGVIVVPLSSKTIQLSRGRI